MTAPGNAPCLSRPAADEPGFKVALRWVVEFPGFPDQIPIPADQMRTRVAIGLRVYEQNLLAL